ncbi:hypothetical protein BLEM_1586 [Bifidobacterium lemurum]|uniref:DUF1893 domain-containing protein n=2 Tax=Bifidobacterium lemurum TaxID=1603886 RepID=A0A261FP83_9BIFI|nr:hypothetical protein BLEM_1586 [Bifidobacterium lemurum]
MFADIERAKAALASDPTLGCAACLGVETVTGMGRGVRPLLQWLANGQDIHGFSAADRVVGKAAALLYVRLGVAAVHGQTMSEAGLSVLRSRGIEASYDALVPMILNRTHTGMCPIEASVQSIRTPDEAEPAIRAAVAKLMASNS